MKNIIILVAFIILATSCGKVESIKDITHPNNGLAKQDNVDKLKDRVKALEDRLDQAYSNLDDLSESIDDIDIDQDTLESTIMANSTSILNLESVLNNLGHTVNTIIDPCGNNVGEFDEVLIVMSNGDIIGYFESGHNSYKQGTRFLTILDDGNYRTTDNQSCNFSIINGEYVE